MIYFADDGYLIIDELFALRFTVECIRYDFYA